MTGRLPRMTPFTGAPASALPALAAAVLDARDGFRDNVKLYTERTDELAADPIRAALCRGQAMAYESAAEHLDDAFVTASGRRGQASRMAGPSGRPATDYQQDAGEMISRAHGAADKEGLVEIALCPGTFVRAATGPPPAGSGPGGMMINAQMPTVAERAALGLPPGVPIMVMTSAAGTRVLDGRRAMMFIAVCGVPVAEELPGVPLPLPPRQKGPGRS